MPINASIPLASVLPQTTSPMDRTMRALQIADAVNVAKMRQEQMRWAREQEDREREEYGRQQQAWQREDRLRAVHQKHAKNIADENYKPWLTDVMAEDPVEGQRLQSAVGKIQEEADAREQQRVTRMLERSNAERARDRANIDEIEGIFEGVVLPSGAIDRGAWGAATMRISSLQGTNGLAQSLVKQFPQGEAVTGPDGRIVQSPAWDEGQIRSILRTFGKVRAAMDKADELIAFDPTKSQYRRGDLAGMVGARRGDSSTTQSNQAPPMPEPVIQGVPEEDYGVPKDTLAAYKAANGIPQNQRLTWPQSQDVRRQHAASNRAPEKPDKTELEQQSNAALAEMAASNPQVLQTLPALRRGDVMAELARTPALRQQYEAKRMEPVRGQAERMLGALDQLIAIDPNTGKARLTDGAKELYGKSAVFRGRSWSPGSAAANAYAALTQVTGQLLVSMMGEMKAQSATGATGFGAMNMREFGAIESASSMLGGNISEDLALEQLRILRNRFTQIMEPGEGETVTTPPDSALSELERRRRARQQGR